MHISCIWVYPCLLLRQPREDSAGLIFWWWHRFNTDTDGITIAQHLMLLKYYNMHFSIGAHIKCQMVICLHQWDVKSVHCIWRLHSKSNIWRGIEALHMQFLCLGTSFNDLLNCFELPWEAIVDLKAYWDVWEEITLLW